MAPIFVLFNVIEVFITNVTSHQFVQDKGHDVAKSDGKVI